MINSNLSMKGTLKPVFIAAPKAPLSWRLKNAARFSFLRGALVNAAAKGISKITGITTMTSELSARVYRAADDQWVDYGVLSYRVVTDTGVTYMRDDFNNEAGGASVSLLNFHGCGTGSVAEAVGDTALGTESTTALNPDSTRATGTRATPAGNQFRSTGTATFDATAAITEHGLFSQAATGGGTLWDRSVFSAINVASGDSIQFQYTLTINSGG